MTPQRYPLAWPSGRPRTPASKRARGGSRMAVEGGKDRPVSIPIACRRLEAEIDRLGGVYPLLSTNVETRMDGTPRADRAAPADPGVCVYFSIGKTPYAMACDRFDTVAQNIAALANHIEATRRIARYGVASAAEALQAFAALPAPGAKPTGETRWWRVLQISAGETPPDLGPNEVARIVITNCYRLEAKRLAANGGDLTALNVARDEALRLLERETA